MTFTLDSSGVVGLAEVGPHEKHWRVWSDLDAFVQGYIEELFASASDPKYDSEAFRQARRSLRCFPMDDAEGTIPSDAGFSDLSPAALALILRDCKAYQGGPKFMQLTAEDGRNFWLNRRLGNFGALYPSLTADFSSVGKVELLERAL